MTHCQIQIIPTSQKSRSLIEERFWRKVKKSTGCWNWTASCFKHPRTREETYGCFWVGDKREKTGKMATAHSIAWMLVKGEIKDGLKVLHKCDNPRCVNPEHLFLGTQMDNVQDMINKGRGKKQRGSKHYNAKLTEQEVKEIRSLYQRGTGRNNPGNSQMLAKKYGITQATIYDVMHKGWKHIK